ncbi:unnamed protein product [Discosporangium mesarthrocarpum]
MEKSLDGNAEEEDEEELGQYEDPLPTPDMSVVKEKSFPMPAITVEEAVLCLGYIDHDCESTCTASTLCVRQCLQSTGLHPSPTCNAYCTVCCPYVTAVLLEP